MTPKYKVFFYQDDIYEVVEFNPSEDCYDNTVFQGTLSDCQAYINLKMGEYL